MTDPNLPVPNLPLLRKAVEWAEAEAAKGSASLWDQWDYSTETPCGTAYCVAGWTVVTARPDVVVREGVFVVGDGAEDEDTEYVSPGFEAQNLLGLTAVEADALFDESNDIARVRAVAEQIAARAGERL